MGAPNGIYETLAWLTKRVDRLCCWVKQLAEEGIPGPPGPPGPKGDKGDKGDPGDITNLYYGSFIFDTQTALTSAIPNPSSTATINVGSTVGFSASGYIKIENEIIGYTGITPISFIGITRGVATSTNSSHAIGTSVNQAQWSPALTAAQVIIDETDLSNGVTLSGVGDVTIANAGVYNFQFSIQFENFGNDFDDVVVWFAINGTPIAKSASHFTIPQSHSSSPGAIIMTVNLFYTCAAGDIMALWWRNRAGRGCITSIASSGSLPQSPGVIFTVNRIG